MAFLRGRLPLNRIVGPILFLAAASLSANPAGRLSGSIADASASAVPNALIHIASPARGLRQSARSGPSGSFEIRDLAPGAYDVTVEAPGFRPLRIAGVTVQVDQATHLALQLTIGDASETIEVRAEFPVIDITLPTRKSLVPREFIASIPLNGRQFLDLALLAPGAIPAPAGTQGGGFTASGIRSQSNVYMLDGVSNSDTQTNQPLNLFRITDAVREFSVQTSAALPELGRGAGAQVNVVTRSGTDHFHGSAFEYLRNTVLQASDFFTNKLGGEKNPLIRNQYGATLGGPVLRGGTYFFASWEALRQVAPQVSPTLVPTAEQRATVTDPVARRLLDYFPLPNAGGQTLITNVRNVDRDDTALVRLDHRLSDRDQASARWTQYWGYGETPGTTPRSGGNFGNSSQVSAMASERHTFSPLLANDLRLGFSRYQVIRDPQDKGFDASTLIPGAPRNAGLPTITIGGGLAQLGTANNFPQGRTANTYELFNDVSATRTRHFVRFGVHARWEDTNRYLDRASRGSLNFANFTDFSRGQINSATFRTGSTYTAWRRIPVSLYWQDQFQLKPNLTLTYGLRYEYPSAIAERANRAGNYVPGTGLIVNGTTQILDIDPARRGPAALVPRTGSFALPSAGMQTDKNNFAPMAGLAWSPGRAAKSVFRLGARLAYDDLISNVPLGMALAPPQNLQTTQTANVTQPARFGWALAFDQNVPLISNAGRQGPGSPTVGILSLQGVDTNLRNAYAAIYHAGFQRLLPGNIVLEADYQGSAGRRLGMYVDVNQPTVIVRDPARRGPVAPNEQVFPDPRFGQIQLAKSIGSSNYNGSVVNVRRQAAHGIVIQSSYTYGKSIDNNSSYFGSGGQQTGEPGAPIDNRNLRLERARSAFDVRHRFVAAFVLPVPAARWLGYAGKDWRLSVVSVLQSGNPFTVVNGGPDTSGFNQATQGNSPNAQNRPNLTGAGPVTQNNRNPDAAFDASRFIAATAGQAGTSGRNVMQGPGLANHNLSIARRFRLTESSFFQLQGEFFNVNNHTNFAAPIADLNNANFGRITQTLGSTAATSTTGGASGGPRVVQLAIRLEF